MNALLAKVPPPAIKDSIFAEKEFALLIVVSIVLPLALYAVMMLKKALSRAAVLVYGIILVVISGANVVLLQRLASMAKISLCTLDNQVFSSEISLALYLLPALFAGIGINIISHVIVSHLGDAQREFARPQAQAGAIDAGTPPAP